jgi:hypothetical protein
VGGKTLLSPQKSNPNRLDAYGDGVMMGAAYAGIK